MFSLRTQSTSARTSAHDRPAVIVTFAELVKILFTRGIIVLRKENPRTEVYHEGWGTRKKNTPWKKTLEENAVIASPPDP